MAQAVAPAQTGTAPRRITIDRPSPGTVTVVDAAGAQQLAFKFGFQGVKVIVLDVDVVLTFPDGGKLVIPGFGLDVMAPKPPQMLFEDGEVSADKLLAHIEEVKLLDHNLDVKLTSADPAVEQAGDYTTPPRPTTPVKVALGDSTTAPHAADLVVSPGLALTGVASNAAPIQSGGGTPSTPNPKRTGDDALGNITGLATTIKLLTPGTGDSSDPGKIKLGYAAAAAEKDASYAAQSSPFVVHGTDASETFEHVGPEPEFRRIVELKPIFYSPYTVTKLAISGLPSWASIVGAEKDPTGQFMVEPDSTGGTGTYRFVLQYIPPADGTGLDDQGFYAGTRFTATVVFKISLNGHTADATASVYFGVADVTSDADLVHVDSHTGATVAVLWAVPPGINVDAGGGDDTVTATVGHDTIDGGAGDNEIRYTGSQTAVFVALGEGDNAATVANGSAGGDILRHIGRVVGSDHDDTLVGNGAANVIEGGAGNDSLVGNDGADTFVGGAGRDTMVGGRTDLLENPDRDTVDYSASRAGVTINLTAATNPQSGGDAEGDLLLSIRDVVGSATSANVLKGNALSNLLVGGSGGDTFIATAGGDTFIGGAGNDVVDYSGYKEGVQVHLGSGTEPGWAQFADGHRDVLIGIENFFAGDGGVTVVGGDDGASLTGGTGKDWLEGGAGNAYLDVIENRELLDLAHANVAALRDISRLVDENQRGGNGTVADVKRVSARVLDAQAGEGDQTYELELAIDAFRRIARAEPGQLKPAPTLERYTPGDVPSAMALVLAQNPTLLSQQAEMKSRRAELDALHASTLPRLDLESDTTAKNFRRQKDAAELEVRTQVVLKYSFTDGGKKSSLIEQAGARLAQQEASFRDQRDSIESDLRKFFWIRSNSRSKATDLNSSVADSEKARELYREQFGGGKRTLLELLDIQNAAYAAQRNRILNLYEERRATYGILRAIGRFVPSVLEAG